MAAVKRYNNVQLDGKPMKIDIVGTNIVTPAVVPAAGGSFGSANGIRRGYVNFGYFIILLNAKVFSQPLIYVSSPFSETFFRFSFTEVLLKFVKLECNS